MNSVAQYIVRHCSSSSVSDRNGDGLEAVFPAISRQLGDGEIMGCYCQYRHSKKSSRWARFGSERLRGSWGPRVSYEALDVSTSENRSMNPSVLIPIQVETIDKEAEVSRRSPEAPHRGPPGVC
ncbi:hypothetical protein Q3G72_005411 [Acer saccharum]|nr:hypothetical protein Q3G72_005411 [Acer saccharum]